VNLAGDNPLIRMLAVLIAIAVGVRIIYELLEPVWPFLLGTIVIFTLVRLTSWYRGRW
jgi:hypothetical protein